MVEPPADGIRKHLDADERLLWSGQPRQGFVLRPIDCFLIPASFLWCGFTFFLEYKALTQIPSTAGPVSVLFPIFGLGFALVGLYLIIGRFLADRYYRAHLIYGVTDKRVLIVSEAPWRNVTSYEIDTLRGLRLVERGDGRGTINLTETARTPLTRGNGLQSWHAALGNAGSFFEVEHPKVVMKILRDQREKR